MLCSRKIQKLNPFNSRTSVYRVHCNDELSRLSRLKSLSFENNTVYGHTFHKKMCPYESSRACTFYSCTTTLCLKDIYNECHNGIDTINLRE